MNGQRRRSTRDGCRLQAEGIVRPMPLPETEDLLAFVAVVELRSFIQAALHLGITQPQLSRRIRRLEAQVGTQLLVRGARRPITLTGHGEGYHEVALGYLERLRALCNAVAQGANEDRVPV